MLSQKDIILLKTIFVTKDDLKRELFDLKTELLNAFVTKEEFYTRFDTAIGEIKAMREELAALTYRSFRHTEQLADHEVRLIALQPPKSQI